MGIGEMESNKFNISTVSQERISNARISHVAFRITLFILTIYDGRV
jgi:hypothetical protein